MNARARSFALGLGLAFVLGVVPFGSAQGKDMHFDDSAIEDTDDPAWFKTTFLDLREDLAEARAAGRQGLMILFSTQGCAYCKAFIERSLKDPVLGTMVREHFDVIHMEIFDDAGMKDFEGKSRPVKDFAKREGAAFSPTLVFYGLDGKRLHQVVGYQSPARFREVLDYLVDGHHRSLSYRDYLERRAAGRLATERPGDLIRDVLFDRPPYNLDRRRSASKPLLVLFEQRDCDTCRNFHAHVLSDPEVRVLLARFQIVRLDARDPSTRVLIPDGRKLTPLRWISGLGLTYLPGMIFFDEAGREVLRNDSLTYRQRMTRSLQYVLDKAYLRDIHFQRYTREKSLERRQRGK